MSTATVAPQTITTREVDAQDVNQLPGSLQKVLNLITAQPRNTDQLRLYTGTKHPTRRITELEERGFVIHRPRINGRLYYAFRNQVRTN
jgi:hypothetical protein